MSLTRLAVLFLLAVTVLASRKKKHVKKNLTPNMKKDTDNLMRMRYFMEYIYDPDPLYLLLSKDVCAAYHHFRDGAKKLVKQMETEETLYQQEKIAKDFIIPCKRDLHSWAKSVNEVLKREHEGRLLKCREIEKQSHTSVLAKKKFDVISSFLQTVEDIELKALEDNPAIVYEKQITSLEQDLERKYYNFVMEAASLQTESIKIAKKYYLLEEVTPPPAMESLGKDPFANPLMTSWIDNFYRLMLRIGREDSCNHSYSIKDFLPNFISSDALSFLEELSANVILGRSSNANIQNLVRSQKTLMKKWQRIIKTFASKFEEFNRAFKFYTQEIEFNAKSNAGLNKVEAFIESEKKLQERSQLHLAC